MYGSKETRPKKTIMEPYVLDMERGPSRAGTTGLVVGNSSLLLLRLRKPGNNTTRTCGLGASLVIATDGNPTVVELAYQQQQQSIRPIF